jgi:hypothetical protein
MVNASASLTHAINNHFAEARFSAPKLALFTHRPVSDPVGRRCPLLIIMNATYAPVAGGRDQLSDDSHFDSQTKLSCIRFI